MKKIIFYCSAALVFLMTDCKKDKPDAENYPPPNVKFNPVALEFVQLPASRYYIYKDSASGITDSVRVIQSMVENYFHQGRAASTCGFLCYDPGEISYYFEKYTLTIGLENKVWFKGIANCQIFFTPLIFSLLGHPAVIIDSNFILYDQQNNLSALWFPLAFSGVNQYSLIPALTIEGVTYTEVHKFFTTNGLQPSDMDYQGTIIYWVKGIGIIKREIRTHNSVKTFLLVRYG